MLLVITIGEGVEEQETFSPGLWDSSAEEVGSERSDWKSRLRSSGDLGLSELIQLKEISLVESNTIEEL